MFSKSLGDYGEWLTEEEYRKKGYKTVAKNFKASGIKQLGEIDVIVKRSQELVFVEVKTRSSTDFMDPVETITWAKKRRLLRAIKSFVTDNPEYHNYSLRIDVSIVNAALDARASKVYIIEDAIQDLS